MKQIFDWLREQISYNKKEAEGKYERWLGTAIGSYSGGKVCALDEALELVNKAEAKWEQECCEWRLFTNADYISPTYETKCGKAIAEIRVSCNFAFCPYCGKKIKVVE